MSNDFTGVKIKDSYGRVVQIVSGSYYDGFGNPITVLSSNYTEVTGSYTLTLSDHVVEVGEAAVTQSLPTAVGNVGKHYTIINASTGSIMILASGSETIGNHPTTNDSYLLVSAGDSPRLFSNNLNWRLV